jgi:hypothetical protein
METTSATPEYDSLEEFINFCLDDERTTFNGNDLCRLNGRLRRPIPELRRELEGYGLKLATRR